MYGLCNGWITEHSTLVEASSGSTAASESYFARLLGLPFVAGAGVHRRRGPVGYLTINGAVEKVRIRGNRRIRVGLAGPGKAFGYEGLIDGDPSPITAITRERSVLLVVPRDLFGRLFDGEDAVSRGFLDVIQKDLLTTLRETLRSSARLAASV